MRQQGGSMPASEPFIVYDCSLVRCPTGRSCVNLRELHDAIHAASEAVIEHHMMRCVLDNYFELYEFPNDLARWCWSSLGDQIVAERLGVVDPYSYATMGDLRSGLLEAIEDRLWGLDRVPWCRPGLELHLIESRLVTYDTGDRVRTPAALFEAIGRMSLRSLFYHYHEGRRRSGGLTDDFSQWLQDFGAEEGLIEAVRKIDFYFLNLHQLRDELLSVFHRRTMESPMTPTGAVR